MRDFRTILEITLAALCLLVLAGLPAAAYSQQPRAQLEIDSQRIDRLRADVEYLASDECAGRRVGTDGIELAAQYLEARFAEIGIEVPPGYRGYRQGFSITRGVQVSGDPAVELLGEALGHGQDYVVASFSGSGSVTDAPLIFAGYGINAPELYWNDYDGIDAQGAAVVIVRGEPQESDPASLFNGDQISIYSDLRRKATTARDLGAAALVVVDNPFHDQADELPEIIPTYSGASFDLPVIHVRRLQLINALIGATGLSWHEILETMDLEGAPMPAVLAETGATIKLEVEKDLVTGFNIVGVIPGAGEELKDEYVVLGAHYDHLGVGGPESYAPQDYGLVHPGAGDNASGVASVLEIARQLVERREDLKRSVVVSLFSAEEIGLIGSGAFAKNPPVPFENINCMLNFDTVGRLRDGELLLGGGGTALEFDEVIAELPAQYGIHLAEDRSGFGGSDHLSFLKSDIPVLFFFTGATPEMHTSRDTADLVNFEGLAQVTGLGGAVAAGLLNRERPLTFQRPAGLVQPRQQTKALQVSMGTIPSFEDSEEPGYVLGDVRAGGPAAEAGLIGGDRIIKIRDRKIASIYDFMFALEDVVPGQTVPVWVVREGQTLRFDVILQAKNVQH